MSFESLALFVAAGVLLNLTPGPDVLYIVSRALRHGRQAGVVAALGITAGCFVHIFAAALGVGALLATSAQAFDVLKWIGAAYLMIVGLQMLLFRAGDAGVASAHHPTPPTDAIGSTDSGRRVFLMGFWTNVLNPKVALFFLAFVPQFIAPAVEHKTLAFLALGLLFNLNGLFVNMAWALAAARLSQRVGLVQQRLAVLERWGGALFIGFGVRLALADNPAR